MDKNTFLRVAEIADQLENLNNCNRRIVDLRTFIPYDHYNDAQWNSILNFFKNLSREDYVLIMASFKSGLFKLEDSNKEDIKRLTEEIEKL